MFENFVLATVFTTLRKKNGLRLKTLNIINNKFKINIANRNISLELRAWKKDLQDNDKSKRLVNCKICSECLTHVTQITKCLLKDY